MVGQLKGPFKKGVNIVSLIPNYDTMNLVMKLGVYTEIPERNLRVQINDTILFLGLEGMYETTDWSYISTLAFLQDMPATTKITYTLREDA